jgi:uncharacterized protein (DUF488 family)
MERSGCISARFDGVKTHRPKILEPWPLPIHPTLFTFGNEGLTIEAFITHLQTAQVKTVVDVRELPLSRKKGFSNSAFCAALSAHGMAYRHAPALGCPKPIRNQYKMDGNWQTYTREFLKYIQTQDASLRELVKIAQAQFGHKQPPSALTV